MRKRSLFLRPAFWWTAFAIWFVVLWILSSYSMPDVDGPEIPHFDKLLHLGYFTLGGVCMMLALYLCAPGREFSAARRFVIVLVSISLIGVLDEWHQTFTAGREGASAADWIADTLGGVVAGVFGFFLGSRIRLGIDTSESRPSS